MNQILIEFGSSPNLFIWKNHTGVARSLDSQRIIKYGLQGSADIIGLISDGRFIAIECKTGSAKQSPKQVKFQLAVERFGGVYILAKSVDDFREKLKCHLKDSSPNTA